MARKHYPDEYKSQIVELLESKAKNQSEIEREYGISQGTMREWRKRYQKIKNSGAQTVESFKIQNIRTPEQQRILELEKRIKDIEEENEILKKATAIFSKLAK